MRERNDDWQDFPQALADRCVKCAQCLPVCPTWQVSRDEAESPRGRIALMVAAAQALVPADEDLVRHLDQCTGCGHCERICPAEVPFRQLADAAQAATRGGARAPWTARWLRRVTGRPGLFNRVIVPVLRLATFLPWRHPLLPPRAAAAPRTGHHAPLGRPNGRTASLFLGCVARATDGAALAAALQALRLAGFAVAVPAGQACCGALHRHAGDGTTAARLAERNHAEFEGDGPIVSCASGCAATLREHAFGARVTDVSTLLAESLSRRSARARTVLHTPCTLDTAGERDGPTRLLEGMRALPSRGRCCGAAGEYLLRQPALAARLRASVLDDIGDAAVVCTSNPGCAMYLRAGLSARGATTAVVHPVLEWLDDDLGPH